MAPNIVVMGGGTGTYTVLTGLKKHETTLSAIVSMMDSGGSNRILRDEFGLLPTSDIRQCMIALADEKQNELLRNLFTYRFSQGIGISGMTFGNLFMAALTDMYGSQKKAILETCTLLGITGSIIPVTYDNVHLIARYANGKEILGEHFIDEPSTPNGDLVELSTVPKAEVSEEAREAILNADIIVLGPGDLFTSTIANLVVKGVPEAIRKSNAKVFYVVNLMTKNGQTDNFTAKKHIEIISNYLGKHPDVSFVQKQFSLSSELKKRYNEEHASVVINDVKDPAFRIVEADFMSGRVVERQKGDTLVRSLVRHDSKKLANAILEAWTIVFSAKS